MAYVVKSVTNNQYKVTVVNQNGALLASPVAAPTVTTSAISDLSVFATTAAMLANDATTYANAVSYVDGKSFVNTSQLSANISNLEVASLSDVLVSSLANNATLVYQSSNDKYVVKQLDLDGGSF